MHRAVRRLALAALLCAAAGAEAGEFKSWSAGPTPALELPDMTGRMHQLRDYRGQVVLVNFWATWCAPCREEMPSIGTLKRRLAGRPFVVLAVNVNEPGSRIRKFLADLPLDFPVLADTDGRTTRAWGVRVLPATFVIARDGRIRYVARGELDWADPHVVSLISELLPPGR
jgi:peroxiredoxin